MPFTNRIRLPIFLHRPQFLEERQVFTKANGEIQTLSAVIKKQYDGVTEIWPEAIHERFKIALSHDNVSVEGERYVGAISQEGDYQIEWPDFLTYPLGRATFKANVTPFNATNSNCTTCDEFTQVVTEDDDIGTISEGASESIAVLDNDAICCYPVTLTIVSINSDLVQSAAVNGTNIDIVMKTPLTSQDNAVLLTYRAACDNGLYDESDVIADIDGSVEPTCLPPENVVVSDITDTGGVASWDDPTPAPGDGYYWELYRQDTPGSPVSTGTEPVGSYPTFADLEPDTDYEFCVRSVCGAENSSFVCYQFTTLANTEGCGLYRLTPTGHSGGVHNVTYLGCDGEYATVVVTTIPRNICARENSPGDPIDIDADFSISITYLGDCE